MKKQYLRGLTLKCRDDYLSFGKLSRSDTYYVLGWPNMDRNCKTIFDTFQHHDVVMHAGKIKHRRDHTFKWR